jgi:polyhydroxybutyrate depolymerase
MRVILGLIQGRLLLLILAVAGMSACSGDAAGPADIAGRYEYRAELPSSCPDGPLAEAVVAGKVKAGNLSYLVRTPVNYDARFAHPLLVVYAAAGASARQTERYTRLTAAATSRGFVVAYVDHRPMSKKNVLELGGVAQSVAKRWCIDRQRVFMTGHSDGGTVSTGLALLESTRADVSGIAVSAAGFTRQDLEAMQCRAPIPVMIMHGAKDTLFPGWGRDTAQWWAHCNGCSAPVAGPDASGCVTYSNCASAAPVLYCEGPQSHREWPGLEARIVEFLLGQQAGAGPPAGAT